MYFSCNYVLVWLCVWFIPVLCCATNLAIVSVQLSVYHCSMLCGVTYSLVDWKQKFLMHWYGITYCCYSFTFLWKNCGFRLGMVRFSDQDQKQCGETMMDVTGAWSLTAGRLLDANLQTSCMYGCWERERSDEILKALTVTDEVGLTTGQPACMIRIDWQMAVMLRVAMRGMQASVTDIAGWMTWQEANSKWVISSIHWRA